MSRPFRQSAVIVLLIVLFASPLAPVRSQDADPTEPEVFASASPPPAPAAAAQTEASVSKRQRHVRPVLSLFGDSRSGKVPRKLKLTLFGDVKLRAVLDRAESIEPGVVSWIGHVDDVPLSEVVLVVKDRQVMAGSITMPGATYTVRWAGDGVHVVSDIDPSRVPGDQHLVAASDGSPPTTPETAGELPAGGPVIDVMVVYTPDARSAAGGTAQIESLISLGVQNTNAAYSNSHVLHRINLVHKQELAYSESGDCESHIKDLTYTSDGRLDQVHDLRNAYAADLVVLATRRGDCAGIAWMLPSLSSSSERYGFSVVRSDRLADLVMAHEIGHNLGADHDHWTNTNLDGGFHGLYPYSQGYVDPSPPHTWVTVMAYQNSCASYGCTRVAYFSNPNVVMDGDPMGIPAGQPLAADNARTFNESVGTVSNFRVRSSSIPASASAISPTGSISAVRPTFTWSKVSDATWYRLRVDGPSGHVYDRQYFAGTCGSTTCAATPEPELAFGNYVWKVQTGSSAGDGPWSAQASFTVMGPPGTAVPVAPKGSKQDNPLTFTWNAASNANWYRLRVNDSRDVAVIQTWFTSAEVCIGATCSVTITTPLQIGSYKWLVQTRNNTIDGPWSKSMGFGVRKPVEAKPIEPSGKVTNPITYRWNPSPNATWYLLWVKSPDGSITQTWFPAPEVCSASPCAVPAPTLAPGKYSWKVMVRNAAGDGSFSSSKGFTVL